MKTESVQSQFARPMRSVWLASLTMCLLNLAPPVVRGATLIDFNIGDIPPQRVWYGQTSQFLVHSDQLGAGATITASASPPPGGTITFDALTRTFGFTPAPGDKTPFGVTFTATLGNSGVSQTARFDPMPELPPEQEVFGLAPVPPMPDPESKDYIVRSDITNSVAEDFNNQSKHTRALTISGKTVVFQSGHANGLYDYNDNGDIKELTIYAESLIIRSPLRLPQTTVTVFARELRFEDTMGATASIDTTPQSLATFPNEAQDGANGLRAGDITLYVQKVAAASCTNRFILRGGDGQRAGLGRDGANGTEKLVLPIRGVPVGAGYFVNHVTYARLYNILGERILTFGTSGDWPSDGGDAVPPGKPGNGGNGANLVSSVDVSSCLTSTGGVAGTKAPDVHGGSAGTPNPAYGIGEALNAFRLEGYWYFNGAKDVTSHSSSAGRDAQAPDPDIPAGQPGSYMLVGNSNSWITPPAFRMILAHAKDLFLQKYNNEAGAILNEYASLLDTFSNLPEWSSLSEQWQLEFAQIRQEIATLQNRIDSHLDFFGNPGGWVPLLSFEANKLAFESEIGRAIRILYIQYWIGNAASTITQKVAALTTARQELKDEIEDYKTQYNDVATLLGPLETQAESISRQLESYQTDLERLQAQLLADAQGNVARQHQILDFTRNAGALLAAFPYAQPIFKGIATGFTFLNGVVGADTTWDQLRAFYGAFDTLRGFKESELKKAADDWKTRVDTIDFSVIEMQGIRQYLTNLYKFAKPIYDVVDAERQKFQKTQVTDTEVETEFGRLKAAHPEFEQLATAITGLMAQKATFGAQVQAAIDSVGTLSDSITKNILAIDGLNRDVSQGDAVLDHRALVYLDDMARRAKERLLKYHYYMAKAYEYRFLKRYTVPLDLTKLFEKFRTIAAADAGKLGSQDFDVLRGVYEAPLSQIAAEILDFYNSTPPAVSHPFLLKLLPDDLDSMNRNHSLTINLYERGLFLPSYENIRIIDLQVTNLDVHVTGSFMSFAYTDISMQHSGASRIRNSDGALYLFRNYNQATTSKIKWGASYDALTRAVSPIVPSVDFRSLITSLFPNTTSDELVLYSRPGAWADLVITNQINADGDANLLVSNLVLVVTCEYTERRADLVELHVVPSESGFTPYFVVDTSDVNDRQDGRGDFRRVYHNGERVSIKAPDVYEFWRFEKWTDRAGNNYGGVLHTNPILQVNSGSNQVVRAQFRYEGPLPIALGPGAVAVQAATNVVFLHSPVTFDSVAFNLFPSNGVPLSYQWQLNGTNISGATNATLTVADASPTNAGNYSVVVNTPSGVFMSAAIQLSVNSPPIVTAQPQNQIAAPGSRVTLTVGVIGTEPFAYQWRFNGTDISGATNAMLIIDNVSLANVGAYSVLVSNIFGGVTSLTAIVLVNQSPRASAGSPQTLECQGMLTRVLLDGSASSDPDGDMLRYVWTLNGTLLGTNRVQEAQLSPGVHLINLTVTDPTGASDSNSVVITIIDSTPPTIVCPTNITVEFTDGSGTAVSFLPVASDLCSIVTVSCTPSSGSIFPIGSTHVLCMAADLASNTVTCGFTVTVSGARSVLSTVRTELETIRMTAHLHRDADEIDDVIEHLTKALKTGLWRDETHLDAEHGDKVFEKAEDAVEELADLVKERRNEIADEVLQGFIERITRSCRLVAQVAIQDVSATGNRREVRKAREEFAEAEDELMEHDWEDAIKEYGDAWEHAVDAR